MQVQCPSCSVVVSLPDDRAGQVVPCPQCGGQMRLPAAGPVAPVPSVPAAGGGGDAAESRKACPYCGEMILAAAQKCRHCHTMLTGPNAGKTSITGQVAPVASGDGKKALILGIIGLVLCCLPIVGIILGALAIKYGNKAKENPAEAGIGQTAVVLGYIAVGLGILMILFNLIGMGSHF
jgi:predicted RNA-binding Zn-ribbon protein involved in translation (DUF1610 family)